ncbi:hypothetical protein BGX34_002017, partial [Mortierella sp. NVP85]
MEPSDSVSVDSRSSSPLLPEALSDLLSDLEASPSPTFISISKPESSTSFLSLEEQEAVSASSTKSVPLKQEPKPWFPRPKSIKLSSNRYKNQMKRYGCICGVKYLYKYRCLDVLTVVLDEWLVKRDHYTKSERPIFKLGALEYIYDMEEQRESIRLLLEDLTDERACYQDVMNYERCPSGRCELKEEARLYDQAIKLYEELNGQL